MLCCCSRFFLPPPPPLIKAVLYQSDFSPTGSAHQWSVTLPESTAGLEGESVILDCSFSYPDPPNKPYTIWGQWFKGNPCNERAEKIYESNESNNRIKLTGNLTKKNCSIEISDLRKTDTGHYCFRFEIPGFDKWTGKLSISVDVEVAEGISTTLTCTSSNVVTQVKPKLTWEGITELTDQKTVNKEKQSLSDRKITSSFTFVPSYQHHLKLIKCVVSCANYQCSKQSNITLQGSENVTLTCSTDSYPQATHTWYKTKRHTNTTQTLNSTGSVLLFKTISRMDFGTFTCVVNNSQGNDTSAADINVKCKYLVIDSPFTSGCRLTIATSLPYSSPFLHLLTDRQPNSAAAEWLEFTDNPQC
uniref:Ig-like domain-containing protein n=1 Tax=Callorhinchus milii TaxID=7868 RepID=A0A4W3K8J6_CALMI